MLPDATDYRTLTAPPSAVAGHRTGAVGVWDYTGQECLPERRYHGLFGLWAARNNLRQYLREWLYDGRDRARPCRVKLDVRLCFVPLLRWLLSWWQSDKLVLAIDPTMKGDQINSIVMSVVYRSCAIPIAWHILPANRPGEWIAPTVCLLALLSEAVPRDMTVLVMYDRGLRSPRLWEQICYVGWHPYVRQ